MGEPKKRQQQKAGISFRCSREYKAWVEGFARHDHRNVSSLVEAALATYAAKKRYGVKPPEDRG